MSISVYKIRTKKNPKTNNSKQKKTKQKWGTVQSSDIFVSLVFYFQ